MEKKVRISILVIGFLIIIALISSGIYDLLLLTTKNIFNEQIIKFIAFILTFALIIFMWKIPPFDEIGESLDNFEKRIKKKRRRL